MQVLGIVIGAGSEGALDAGVAEGMAAGRLRG